MTEEQIECRVEKLTDWLDRRLIAGELPQREYDLAISDLAIWADHQYRRMSHAEA